MGKAYSEEEREAIRQRLWEEALVMFHDGKKKTLNIRELTERTGISLGSFYSFYEDKRSLINDIAKYRANQKLELLKATFPDSGKDPVSYLFDILYTNITDMGQKLRNREIYREMFHEIFEGQEDKLNRFMDIYRFFLEELEAYWKRERTACEMDVEGIMSLIRGIVSFYASAQYMQESYFDELLRLFLKGGVERYVVFRKAEAPAGEEEQAASAADRRKEHDSEF